MKKIIFALLVSGCAWTSFDDLEDSTPSRAQEKPDGVKGTDYGTALVGVTAPSTSSGGKVSVLSTGPGNYSTLNLDANGKDQGLGDNETLGVHTIDTLTGNAMVLFDGTSQVVLIDNSNVGTVIAVAGTADALTNDLQIPTPSVPSGAAFSNGELVISAPATATVPDNLFYAKPMDRVVVACAATSAGSPLTSAGVAIAGGKAWVYTQAGALAAFDLAMLQTPTGACLPVSSGGPMGTLAPTSEITGLPPASAGGHVDIIGDLAIVTTYASGTGGFVTVVNTATGVVGMQMQSDGVHAVAANTFDGQILVALGYPFRGDSGTAATGAVDLHELGADGTLSAAMQTLSIPNADANLAFGRAVTTTSYNGKPIVVVGANNTVFSFYSTQLYTKR
ncbi:MAG TPA: hypothetical protein VGC41_26880 [Kofleriaceae bacterium]